MKKIYEHNDKALKSFIANYHQIDLLESSKKGLLLEINNHSNNSSTVVFIKRYTLNRIMKMISENYFGISKREYITNRISVSHVDSEGQCSGKGTIEVWKDADKDEITIVIFAKGRKPYCQFIYFKFNDILTVENI